MDRRGGGERETERENTQGFQGQKQRETETLSISEHQEIPDMVLFPIWPFISKIQNILLQVQAPDFSSQGPRWECGGSSPS